MKRSTLLILAALVALAGLTVGATFAVVARDHDGARQAREDRAAKATAAIARATQQTVRGLDGLDSLAVATGAPPPAAYRRLATSLLEQPEVTAFSWVPRVLPSGRAAFERRSGQTIVDVRARKPTGPEPARGQYFPVTLLTGRTPLARPTTPDAGADPVRIAAILAAARSGQPRATAPVKLLRGQPGIVIYQPTYRPGAPVRTPVERIRALTGLAAGVYDTQRLLAAIATQLPSGTRVAVSDGRAPLMSHIVRPPNAVTRTVSVAGRQWTVTVGGPAASASSLPLAIGVGGAALTVIVALLFLGAGRRERYALARVRERMAERDHAEAALREAEGRFRGAFESAPIGMALVAMDERFLQVNAALCRLTGYAADQLEGTSVESITHPEDREIGRERIAAMIEGGRSTVSVESRYLHASGHTIWVSIHTRLLRDADGAAKHFISMVEDVTDRRQFEHKLRYMADHDALTGLVNRRRFEEEVERQAAQAARYGGGGAILMLDLDHFKYINDSLGHRAGDELIVAVSKLLRAQLRDTDTLARLGGDEFAVLLPRASEEDARTVADKLLDTVRREAVTFGLRKRRLTASLGIALVDESGRLTADDLLVNADLALYDAKEGGRDCVRLFADEEQQEARMRARVTWVERIQSALENDGFVLFVQPILDLRTRLVVRHELLLRMRGDDGDLIPPGAFLYVAERYGLINEIDRWVVRHAIGLVATARDAGRELRVEVNISGLSLGDEELLALIERELTATQINPGNVVFEVTETAAVSNIVAARDFAERVCALGCRFALDDFGAGYGSFYYLKHLPFDYVKIDGEFVRNCVESETDQLVVQAVVQIAKGLGKQTIAEFVEDEETIEVLQRFGVDYAQGYHVGRPAPLTPDLIEAESRA